MVIRQASLSPPLGSLVVPQGDSAYVALLTDVMPKGLMGVCLAGLLAAIMSSVDSGLCSCGSLINFDFFAKIKKNVSDQALLKSGRIIMFTLLVLCILVAPSIRRFHGLFDYLLYIWALLAPPVFVCVIFGLGYKKANAKAAFLTLMVGLVLGFGAFVFLKFPQLETVRENVHPYLNNKLNLGFINTIICAVVMLLGCRFFAHTQEDKEKAAYVRQSRDVMPMTPKQKVKYRLFLSTLLIIWFAVLFFFSPIGIGKKAESQQSQGDDAAFVVTK